MLPEIIHKKENLKVPTAFKDLGRGEFFTLKHTGGLFSKADEDHAFIWEPSRGPSPAGPYELTPGWRHEDEITPVRVRIEVTP